MSRINRVPKGLQDLLGSQNLGANPADLSQVVAPTVDLFPFWAAEKLTLIGNVPFDYGNADVVLATFIVPQGEAWIPVHVSAQAALATAGDSTYFEIQVKQVGNLAPGTPGPNTGFVLAASETYTSTATADIVAATYSWPQRIVLPSGSTFEVLNLGGDITAAAATMRARMMYYRLAI